MALFPEEGRYNDGVFNVCARHGFLPSSHPATTLPPDFQAVQDVIDAMPVWLRYAEDGTGTHGLLHTPGALPTAVEALPNYLALVEPLSAPQDAKLLHVLFRAYAFVASAYLLEPAYASQSFPDDPELSERQRKRLCYGRGSSRLPANVAQPFCAAARKLGQHPFLEYHYAYALGNYRLIDPELPAEQLMHYSNLGMACSFSGTPDEVGFIQLHTHIVSHTGPMLKCMGRALHAAEAGLLQDLRVSLRDLNGVLCEINGTRRLMWEASRHERYNDFRIFIMGIKGNGAIFGDGVIYEGVEELGGEPQNFCGQTGAQDDTIPTCDIFAGVVDHYPTNSLTEALKEFRHYRPVVVQSFFKDLEQKVRESGLLGTVRADPESALWLASVVDQIYQFRNGHWQFVQKYIMANTDHPVATGGTPVIHWLPNQIGCCLKYLAELLGLAAGVQDGECRQQLQLLLEHQVEREAVLAEQIRTMEEHWSSAVKLGRSGSFGADAVIELNGRLCEGTDEMLAAKAAAAAATSMAAARAGCPHRQT